ncbi:hypothetical protein [Salinigranum marinum]|nr:hypothetical protein [Salinigranum marinum]
MEYSLTPAGDSLGIVVNASEEWREVYLEQRDGADAEDVD